MSVTRPSSTVDLLRWPEEPSPLPAPRTPVRPQPTTGIGAILLGASLTPEEAESLQKKKPNSELKKKEMSGSGIFCADADAESNKPVAPMDKRPLKPIAHMSQISFGLEDSISPRKPTSLPEVAKQRELTGTLDAAAEDTHSRKPTSTAKVKELVGNNIFAPASAADIQPKSSMGNLDGAGHDASDSFSTPSKLLGSSLAVFGLGMDEGFDHSVKKLNAHKVFELTGNNIFQDNAAPALTEKPLSAAKIKEIVGNDIFADEKPVSRDHLGGIRKPPGGESSLTLV